MAKIRQSNLDNTVITGLTEVTTVADDTDVFLVYDTSAGRLKKIQRSKVRLNAPTVTSVSPTNVTTGDGTGNHTFTITGTNLLGGTASLVKAGGASLAFDSTTVNSATSITGVIAKSTLVGGTDEPYDVKVVTSDGSSTLENQINVDQQPVFTTAAGSLGSYQEQTAASFTINATDPESAGNVTFELQSGSLPPGLSLTNEGTEGGTARISGTGSTDITNNTTYNFVIRAVDAASNTSSRAFSITETAFNVTSFTSSGTFAVPSGVSSLTAVLVVGGGGNSGGWSGYHPDHGRCGSQNGGGGAGGLIYMPGYPVTPGGTLTVTVGCAGSDSVVGAPSDPGLAGDVLTAKGGGSGGSAHVIPAYRNGRPGGSGGGGSPGSPSCGTATQPTQPGDSGAYGFGNNGGKGGGGAGAAGTTSAGGVGKAYTIADGSTSVFYAGGGGKTGTPGGQGGGGGPGPNCGAPGTANRGGGGGAGPASPGPDLGGGGKGIVVISY
tara:strand:+ start:493 stop:1974 length:1482 start_codon:yes stop_codon:yes gene_type:complete